VLRQHQRPHCYVMPTYCLTFWAPLNLVRLLRMMLDWFACRRITLLVSQHYSAPSTPCAASCCCRRSNQTPGCHSPQQKVSAVRSSCRPCWHASLVVWIPVLSRISQRYRRSHTAAVACRRN